MRLTEKTLKKYERRDERILTLIAMTYKGRPKFTYQAVADKCNVSRSTVCNVVKRYKLQTPAVEK